MTFFNWKLNFFMVFIINWSRGELSPTGENVCLKTKTYSEIIKVAETRTEYYTVREWCMSLTEFFRCDKRKSTQKRVFVPKTVVRTKIVPECCDGYVEDANTNSSCIPVCSSECIHGECISPDKCACDSGFYGVNCQTPCPPGRWGRNCSEECDCLNNAECGRVNGDCSCQPGWQGYRCEYPCPEGYHGLFCEERCKCKGNPCDHITGICIITTSEMTTTTSTTEITSTETSTISRTNSVGVDDQTKTEQVPTNNFTTTESSTYDFITEEEVSTDIFIIEKSSTDNLAINETDNGDDDDGEKHSYADYTMFRFLPSLTVLSGISILIFIIAARWLFINHRMKARMDRPKEDIVYNVEGQKFCQRDSTFMDSCAAENAIYLSDLDMNRSAPMLLTFKPPKKDLVKT